MDKPPLPPKIKLDNFRKAIAGSRGYVSKSQYDALKKVGLGDLQYASANKIIGKDRAQKAIQALKKAKEIGSRPGYTIWQKAADLERRQIMRKEAMRRGNIQAALALDVDEQMTFEEMNKSIYTKKSFSSINERMQFEKEMREKKISEAQKKRSDLLNAGQALGSPKIPDFPLK